MSKGPSIITDLFLLKSFVAKRPFFLIIEDGGQEQKYIINVTDKIDMANDCNKVLFRFNGVLMLVIKIEDEILQEEGLFKVISANGKTTTTFKHSNERIMKV